MDNYRPISLATAFSKIFEIVLLDRIQMYLVTASNQFGFKKGIGTDMCLYAMKEIVDNHRRMGGNVFMCFLDASKAFDRVNFHKLFEKMETRGIPKYVIRILEYWYTNQSMYVRWGNVTSDKFGVSNGVKQGGIISSHLFNIYLVKRLYKNQSKILFVEHILY